MERYRAGDQLTADDMNRLIELYNKPESRRIVTSGPILPGYRIPVRSEVDIGPYGIGQIKSCDKKKGTYLLQQPKKPDNAEIAKLFMVLDSRGIKKDGLGWASHLLMPNYVAIELQDDSDFDEIELWGPKADSNKLHKGCGNFRVFGRPRVLNNTKVVRAICLGIPPIHFWSEIDTDVQPVGNDFNALTVNIINDQTAISDDGTIWQNALMAKDDFYCGTYQVELTLHVEFGELPDNYYYNYYYSEAQFHLVALPKTWEQGNGSGGPDGYRNLNLQYAFQGVKGFYQYPEDSNTHKSHQGTPNYRHGLIVPLFEGERLGYLTYTSSINPATNKPIQAHMNGTVAMRRISDYPRYENPDT